MNIQKIILTLFLGVITTSAMAQEPLSLEKAIALALKNSYNITISKLETDIADRNNTLSAVGAYPSITGSAGYNFGKELVKDPHMMTNGGNASIDGTWTLFNGFKIKLGKRIAEMKYDLSKGGEAVQIESTIVDVTMAYYTYIIEKELYSLYKVIYKLSKDRYDRDKAAYDIGSKGSYELIQSESAYLSDKQTLVNQERRVKSSLYLLNASMALDATTEWIIQEKITVPRTKYDIGQLMELMLSDNESLKNQYISQSIIDQNAEMVKRDWMPKIDLKAGLRYNGSVQSFAGRNESSNSLQPYAGATMTTTIYGNGVKQRNTFIANIQSQIGKVSIDQMKLSLSTKLMTEYDGFSYNLELLELAERDLKVSGDNLKLSWEKFTSGSISSFDYRSVQVTYQRAALNALQVTYNVLKNNVEIVRLTGGFVK